MMIRDRVKRGLIAVVFLVFLIITLFPIYWMFSLSFMPTSDYFTDIPLLFPRNFTLRGYVDMLKLSSFASYFWNSIIVSVSSTVVTIIIGVCEEYAVARFPLPGRTSYISSLLITQMFPSVLLIIPLLQIIKFFGLYDTHYALIITYIAFCAPFSIWILKGYIETIPVEIEEAALMDGCSILNIVFRIIFPIIMPAIVTITIYTFLMSWGEFIFALTFIGKESLKTLPIGLAMCFAEYQTEWGIVMSMAVVYSLPPLLIFSLCHKYIVKGLTAGAVKM